MADHPGDPPALSAADARALYSMLVERGVECWVMGGWGVDALLGDVTRQHHDLDLLVSRSDLGVLLDGLDEHGFREKLVWEESRWVDVAGVARPTAFVQVDDAGRELDVHLVEVVDGGPPVVVCDVPWALDEASLTATGVLDGRRVRCVSATTQLQMHTGYDLPPEHRDDVDRIGRWLASAGERRDQVP